MALYTEGELNDQQKLLYTRPACPHLKKEKCGGHLHSFMDVAPWESGSKTTAKAVTYIRLLQLQQKQAAFHGFNK